MQFAARYGQQAGAASPYAARGAMPAYGGAPGGLNRGASSSNLSRQHPHQLAGEQIEPTRGQLRAEARRKWAAAWGGPHYLDPGSANRHTLAIKSGIPNELAWALHRLLQVSSADPDLVRFQDFPGLLDALLNTVSSSLNSKTMAPTVKEAMLLLRNMSTEKLNSINNVKFLLASPRLSKVMTTILESYTDDSAEITLYALEILEVIADKTPLYLPGKTVRTKRARQTHQDSSAEDSTDDASQRHLPVQDSPSTRLFPALVKLTLSSDRAIVIATYRVLTALSAVSSSELVLSLLAYDLPFPHPIDTAVSFLPLFDFDLSVAAIDFIYVHTLIPYNAARFCARRDLLSVLRLISSKLHHGAELESLDVPIPMFGTEGETWHRSSTFKFWVKDTRPKHSLDSRLTVKERADLIEIKNSDQRAAAWLTTIYEGAPGHSVTQVDLWTAYRESIMTMPDLAEVKTLAASDVIRKSSEVFPTATPSVIDVGNERKFVIAGMRLRDRTSMKTVFACKWIGCTTGDGPTSPIELYHHIVSAHLTDVTLHCSWSACAYRATSRHDMMHHVRTHILPYRPPAGYGNPPEPKPLAPAGQHAPLPTLSLKHHRWHTPMDENREPTGIGYLGALVLRNVARTVKAALDTVGSKLEARRPSTAVTNGTTGRQAGIGGGGGRNAAQSLLQLTQDETSIFDELSRDTSTTASSASSAKRNAAQAGLDTTNGNGQAAIHRDRAALAVRMASDRQLELELENVDYGQAIDGLPALVSIGEDVTRTTLADHSLGRHLSEVVLIAEACRKMLDQYEVVFGNQRRAITES